MNDDYKNYRILFPEHFIVRSLSYLQFMLVQEIAISTLGARYKNCSDKLFYPEGSYEACALEILGNQMWHCSELFLDDIERTDATREYDFEGFIRVLGTDMLTFKNGKYAQSYLKMKVTSTRNFILLRRPENG